MTNLSIPVIIHGNYNVLFSTIFALLDRHNIRTITQPEFIYHDRIYLTGYPDPDGISVKHVFFIGEPQSVSRELTAKLIQTRMPESEIVLLQLPINEERLLSTIEEKLLSHISEEGQPNRRLP